MSKSSYKYRRSRKPLSVKKLKLRLKDSINSLEPVILGDPDHFDRKTIQLRIQAAHAISGLVGKYRKIIETEELEERIAKLEEKL